MQSVIGDVPRSIDNDSEVFEIFIVFLCLSWPHNWTLRPDGFKDCTASYFRSTVAICYQQPVHFAQSNFELFSLSEYVTSGI